MTDSPTAMPAQPTPLAQALTAKGAFELTEAFGTLTPKLFTTPGEELDALLHGAAVHDLGWLTRVTVRGEDRFRWLNGMVTNTVRDLPEQGGSWNFALNAQGRILGDLKVWRYRDLLELELECRQQARLLEHFEKFIIMDDVELSPQFGLTALGVAGATSLAMLKRLGIHPPAGPMQSRRVVFSGIEFLLEQGPESSVPHLTLWMPAPSLAAFLPDLLRAGAYPVGFEATEALRIAEGVPVYGIDIAERDLPQETSQQHRLSFNKGCYQGQELVERVRARGQVHRHLRLLELSGPLPAPGDELFSADGKCAGQVTSAAALPLPGAPRAFALAMIGAVAEVRNQPLSFQNGDGTARLLAAPLALDQPSVG